MRNIDATMPPFVVFALPRSRTTWLSKFLSYGPWVAVHDAMMNLASAKALQDLLALPQTGLVETGMAFAWKLVKRYAPECRIAVVRRPLHEVTASLTRLGWDMNPAWLKENDGYLDAIEQEPGTISVSFDELRMASGCQRIFEHCVREPFDNQWWASLEGQNLQVDMRAVGREFAAKSNQIYATMDEMRSLTAPCMFQVEHWQDFYLDCLPLMQMHSEEVGILHPKMPYEPNIQAGEQLDNSGNGVIVTARADGRLVGYVCFIMYPSLESRRILCASQSGSFIHPDFRRDGNWQRLYESALTALKQRGVKMVFPRHGKRGSGPGMEAFFKRIGAEENGRDYTLWIGD